MARSLSVREARALIKRYRDLDKQLRAVTAMREEMLGEIAAEIRKMLEEGWSFVRVDGDTVSDVFVQPLSAASCGFLDNGIWRGMPFAKRVRGSVQKTKLSDVVCRRHRIGVTCNVWTDDSWVHQGLAGGWTGPVDVCGVED